MVKRFYSLCCISLLFGCTIFAGNPDNEADTSNSVSDFKILINIPSTSIKDQYRTSTCWSFSTISMVESELLRTQKKEYNLSEMYIIRKIYDNKAERYLRMHGKMNFAGGGEPNDVTDIIRNYGIVPEEAYSGLKSDTIGHIHTEMDMELKNYVDNLVQKNGEKENVDWEKNFNDILDDYLGKMPKKFSYNHQEYDAESFARYLGIDPDNYIMLTSFTHHPYYSPFILELPDNWSWGQAYNLPLDELVQVTNYAIDSGYSVTWSTDISEPGFNYDLGIALAPKIVYQPETKDEQRKIAKMPEREKEEFLFSLDQPLEEITVTGQLRQAAFDAYATTDDHAMHIIGRAIDKNGKQYFYIKNSWGTDNKYQGHMFISESYFRYKTIHIFLNKAAIPADIILKLNLEQNPRVDGM